MTARPALARHMRLKYDSARQQHVLLGPESVVVLNRTGAAILGLCDGQRTVAEIVAELGQVYVNVAADEVSGYLGRLAANRCVEMHDGE
jgi:pyrroloquinoline quinone biosynthesis protein D